MQSGGNAPDPITASLSESDVTNALRAFLMSILPGNVVVMLGQRNRVAPPAGPFVLMTIILRQQIATNGSRYTSSARIVTRQERVTIQISAFGVGAGDRIERIVTLLRDPYATEFFSGVNSAVAPLYADDPRQMAFVNDSHQYEDQWSADLHVQANYEFTIPQQFADKLTIDTLEVDTTYPPEE